MVDVDERYAEEDPTGRRRVDPDAFPIEHGQLDLAPMVREEVLLAVPDAPLCRPDCAGLCPTCGADRNAAPCDCDTAVRDDRWAALDRAAAGGSRPSIRGFQCGEAPHETLGCDETLGWGVQEDPGRHLR